MRLTSAACAALLLCLPTAAAAAQRRRAPRTTTTPAQTPAQRAPAQTRPAPPARPAPAEQSQQAQPRGTEVSRPFEDMIAAESYGVYVELRRVGTLVGSAHVKSAFDSLRVSGDLPKELLAVMAFAETHAETLAESRIAVAALPAREGLPPVLIALELESPAAAAAFEPKFRAFAGESFKNFLGVEPAPRPAPRRGQQAPPSAPSAGSSMRRAGNWLLAANEPFTLKKLRAEDETPLSGSPRFQSARTRFANEYLFVYVESDPVQQGWAVQRARDERQFQKLEEERLAAEAARPNLPVPGVQAEVAAPTPLQPQGAGVGEMAAAAAAGPTPDQPREDPDPDPEGPDDEDMPPPPPVVVDETAVSVGPNGERLRGTVTAEVAAVPTEEQRAVQSMGRVFGGIFSGIPRIPAAVAFALTLEGEAVALRLAVENPPEGSVNVIPFLPNVISGPPVTADAAEVAPADAALFISGSLDWPKMFTAMLGTADLPASLNVGVVESPLGEAEGAEDAKAEKQPSAQETIAAVEKLFGFKFREELLPALGNEVAVSIPFSILADEGFITGRRPKKDEPERDSEPGLTFIVSLNDPDKMKHLMPRLLGMLGAAALGVQFKSERREGFDVRSSPLVSYAVIDRFLVASDNVKAVRHVVDSYAARRTLGSTASYRDSTQWQARQRLLHAYLSEALMRHQIDDTKKRAGGSHDPVVQALLAQMDAAPEPASYGATHEGDQIVHEARLPLSLVKTFALGIQVGYREAPILSGEMMAVFAMRRILDAQIEFKVGKKKERFGTLEELTAEKLLEKGFLTHLEYNVEMSSTGDKLEIFATPKNYGKTGRRSFMLDAEGVLRGADHKGERASSDDPPLDF